MNGIFFGLLLALASLSFKITDNLSLNVIPDFIGFILIWRGMKTLSDRSGKIKKAVPVAAAAILVSFAYYVVYMFHAVADVTASKILFSVYTLGKYAVVYLIIVGFEELEALTGYDLCTKILKIVLLIMTFCQAIRIAGEYIDGRVTLGALFVLIASMMYFFIKVYDAKKNFEERVERK